jgi:hypothetical protein
MSFLTNNTEVKEWIDLLLLDGKDFYLGLIGISIFIGTPIIMMIYGGMKILFKIKYINRWINLAAGIVWVIGFFILLTLGIKTGSDFSKTAKVRENINVTDYNTLYLKMHETPVKLEEINITDEDEEGERNYKSRNKNNDDYMIGTSNGLKYLLGHAQLNIIKSQTDKITLVVVKESKGVDKRAATIRAKNISYQVIQQDSLIEFDNLFKVSNADKFRVQDITVILKIPVGKVIYLDKSLENLIYDIENITNTYDGDMINRRWIMTENGLKCIDCDGLDSNSNKLNQDVEVDEDFDENGNVSKHVRINVNGIHINAKDANIKMDSNGIKIHSIKSNITIDKNGVNVESKK